MVAEKEYNSEEEEFSDEEEVIQVDNGLTRIVIVDNLPVVPEAKFEKLLGVVKKIYTQIGKIAENGIGMPMDEATKMSKGY